MDVVVAEHLSKTYQAGAVAVSAVREASFAIGQFRGANLGFIFQDFNLIPVLSAAENGALLLLRPEWLMFG